MDEKPNLLEYNNEMWDLCYICSFCGECECCFELKELYEYPDLWKKLEKELYSNE